MTKQSALEAVDSALMLLYDETSVENPSADVEQVIEELGELREAIENGTLEDGDVCLV
jgi:hypothetical protein